MVCAVRRKKAGKELRARGPSIVGAPKIVSHVYTLPSPRTRSHISLDFTVFISSESCEHMPCHAIVGVMSVLNDIFPVLIVTLSQFIAKIR